MRDLLIGIDAGTSVIKAVAFDLSGRELASASRRNQYKTLPNGGVEQDMRRTWNDTVAVLKELADSELNISSRALALAVTGQGDGSWLVDADGEPVHDGWLWLDSRAAEEAKEIAESEGIESIYRHTASGVTVCQMRTHFLWMKRNAPELLSKAATAFHCKDWLYLRLTGDRATDPTEATFSFGNFRKRQYSDEVLEALGCEDLKRLLPPIVDGAEEHGTLLPAIAEATGLPSGIPVSLGCIDVLCAAIGAGLHDRDAMPGLTVLGSTGVHMRFVENADKVVLNPDRTGYTMPFPGEAYAQMQTNMAATLNIDWVLGIAQQLLSSEGVEKTASDLLKHLDEKVLAADPGKTIYHPYISSAGERGPFTEPSARASFTGLDQTVGWFDLVRSVYDSQALAARDCYAAMGEIPSEIRIVGGAARSVAIRKLLASALRSPVRTLERDEAGAAGAAMIAAVCQGKFEDISEATRCWVDPILQPHEYPDPDLANAYDTIFEAYVATRKSLRATWEAQAQMRKQLR
ncbi:MAG: carbohydrate kinase [Albidovulum sp.]|nr:carbohydrate kinase [Albidovulum sp.]